jgi:hypothetical protein
MGMRLAGIVLVLLLAPAMAVSQVGLDQLLLSHETALGGKAAIQDLHTIVVRGVYHEPGPIPEGAPLIPHGYQAWMRPYFEHIGDPADQHPEIREGFDGSAWEYYGDPGVTVRTVGAAAAATRHAAEFLQDSLIDAASKGTQLTFEGLEEIDHEPAWRIHAKLMDGFEKIIFVDKQTMMIVAERKSAPVHAFGEAVATETRFSGYKPFDGVMMWQSARETNIKTGAVLNEFRRVTIEVNTLSDASEFSPPNLPQTPLQHWLELLYAERADSISVLYSYRLFRKANPTIDTREGVEFIAYQMVKMGDVKSAIELLQANAVDYPESASAQFGLGRAYKTAGDAESARKAFSRALAIDPNFKKATDGLNGLR